MISKPSGETFLNDDDGQGEEEFKEDDDQLLLISALHQYTTA